MTSNEAAQLADRIARHPARNLDDMIIKYESLQWSLLDDGPGEYRSKWGLPSDYPMVAPNYSATRSALAKSAGLGRKPGPLPRKGARAGAKT